MSQDRQAATERNARMLRELDDARCLKLQSPFEQRYPALALQANDVRHTRKRLS